MAHKKVTKKETVLITGGAGYIGSVLCGLMLEWGYSVVCVDRFFFGEESIALYKAHQAFRYVRADIRTLKPDLFKGIDCVIDLAGLSNDPACDLSEDLTLGINYKGAVNVGKMAKKAGVRRLIYASSCNVYGKAEVSPVSETSACNPVSLYAKCKLLAEESLSKLADKKFCVTFLRFATVYGGSSRMRFDLIINIMTMFAYTQRKITVLGGGQQWRPVVHVKDIATVVKAVLDSQPDLVNREIYNVGSNKQNYRVIEVARTLQDIIPGVSVDVAPDDEDKRSYNVEFGKIEKVFKFTPASDITSGVHEILDLMRTGAADPTDPRTSTSKYYKYLLDAEKTIESIRFGGKVI